MALLDPQQSDTEASARKRDPERARESILLAAIGEFCDFGFERAKLTRIVAQAGYSVRMVYHYFGGKEQLYLAVLERVYADLRKREAELNLEHLQPIDGIRALVSFTFGYMADHPEFITLIRTENQLGGRFLKKSARVREGTTPLLKAIDDLLRRGEKLELFRQDVDPIQLYITILSLSFVHISNQHTLSIIFQTDLRDKTWIEQRLEHAVQVILGYLQGGPEGATVTLLAKR